MLKRWAAWPPGIRWLVAIAAVTLAAAIVWALFVPLADWLAHHDVGSATGTLHETALDNARGRLLTLGAGLVAGGALVFTALNFNLLRRNSEQTDQWQRRTHELTEQGQITDRYTKAVEQLGSDKLDVRIGGIYALERVARDSAIDHPTVMEVLTAFIREHSQEPWPVDGEGAQQGEKKTRPDVQAAVTAAGRRDASRDILPIDLVGADLVGADLTAADLTAANLTDANLTDAKLAGAKLTHADLYGANLTSADLIRANLGGAFLAGANLHGAFLVGADLTRADLTRAFLGEADLTRANLGGAHLTGANLRSADLTDADLRGADLTSAHLTSANLASANLASANLTGADLTGADLTGADLTGAHLAGADLVGADLVGADLTAADLTAADLTDANLTGVRWPEVSAGSERLDGRRRFRPTEVRGAVIRGNCPLSLVTQMGSCGNVLCRGVRFGRVISDSCAARSWSYPDRALAAVRSAGTLHHRARLGRLWTSSRAREGDDPRGLRSPRVWTRLAFPVTATTRNHHSSGVARG